MQSYMDFVRGAEGRKRFSAWLLLAPSSWAGLLLVVVLDFLYRHGLKRIQEPAIPVISVGNISYGGTNKTPFVEMLCRMMREKGVSAGIVSRGYGGANSDVLVFENGKANRRAVGDEPLLLSSHLPDVPVAISRDRAAGLLALERRGIELAVADDAFQHRRMARDVDVVLIDAACPFGNGRLIPAGILREPIENLRRAHIVVVTKVEEVDRDTLSALHERLSRYVPPERIFDARLVVRDRTLWDGESFRPLTSTMRGRGVLAFSAIGNPDSFIHSLRKEGADVLAERHFRDHHLYTAADMEELAAAARASDAEFLACTEKDVYNLPCSWKPGFPLVVPRVATTLDDPERFCEVLVDCLRPRLVVASNGYGEDAIGVLMAQKLRAAFPEAEVTAFPLVGRGEAYRTSGFSVGSTPSVTPSGGVLKYRLRDLWGDIQAGLFGHIREQQGDWRKIANTVRTPICVGDVYLLLHALWGQGVAPLFVATAKTVRLSGHWRLERFIIHRYSRRTWTRDQDTADQLSASGADAIYAGNPIMDLLGDVPAAPSKGPATPLKGSATPLKGSMTPLVMLLPGSRLRAYDDVQLLLDAVEKLQARKACGYVMALAPTIDPVRLLSSCRGWRLQLESEPVLTRGGVRIRLHRGNVAAAASEAMLLIGLGGTANQLCAGMGIPVVSIDEKGKRVQKKLLEDSEVLVEPTSDALAGSAFRILTTPGLYKKMSDAGRSRMGEPGALDSVARYAGEVLGWRVRCRVYGKLAVCRGRGLNKV
ncbi:MAG: tetraacyldisaccharide 4'-kinase [Synergistaceae bacterium]|nr:tetraacyldisaccharide 4'-kinase [Synergistaceae bacterium]